MQANEAFVSGALVAALFFVALSGCGEEVIPPALDDIGDPCRSAITHCIDDDSVMRCEADVWTEVSCEVSCAELGPAYVADGCEQGCTCTLVDPSGCVPDETICMDDDNLGVCDESQSWETFPCDVLCATLQLEPLGCMEQLVEGPTEEYVADCWCTAEGAGCDLTSAPTCVDESTIAQCVDDIWVFEDCSTLCGGPALCEPWLTPAACDC
jgi:hypothetical protein